MSDNFMIDDNEERKSYQKTVALCVEAASLVVLGFLVILYMNSKDKAQKAREELQRLNEESAVASEEEFTTSSHNFTSEELDFWKDANINESKPNEPEPSTNPVPFNKDDRDKEDNESPFANRNSREDGESLEEDRDLEDINDEEEYDDENHIAVIDEDGKRKYYEIMSDVPKNEYNLKEALSVEDNKYKYEDSKWESVYGIDLSKSNGTVDWKKVKEDDVEFAMLRLGSRGYVSGAIELDEKFVEYAQNAQVNNIDIGAYFYSNAINEVEAVEEANYIVGAIGTFNIKYPVAIRIEKINDKDARTNKLTLKERTELVKKFCETVKGYGYKPVISASRDMLISGLDLSELTDYDIWLSDTTAETDFPYDFTMWQYSTTGKVDGIESDVNLNISFRDYGDR